jgi:ferrous iron transport protein B
MATTSPSDAPKPTPSSLSGPDAEAPTGRPVIVLAGNPNCGKTSVFNALTGLRRKVGNYPGITVDRVEGDFRLADGRKARLVDLPGCYSLLPRGEDERLARGVLLGLDPRLPEPDVVVAVLDASNLERNLYFATQLLDMRVPLVVALNMVDVAEERGIPVDAAALEASLGVPVVSVSGRTGANANALREAIGRAAAPGRLWSLSVDGETALDTLVQAILSEGVLPERIVEAEAVRLLFHGTDPAAHGGVVGQVQAELDDAGVDRLALEAECRYLFCRDVARKARGDKAPRGPSRSERVDRLLTHRVLGPIVFLGVMAAMFLAVFAGADEAMGAIETATGWLQGLVSEHLGEGILHDLLVDGVIAGVGNVLIFLPQICILFLFLAVLEDLGYMARAAFLIDRLMRGVGLSGKAFVPLMSSFACAIPGIMSARTIESRRDRLVTILVAPLMSCSARLPVYVLLIGAFIPVGLQSLTMLSMYMLSVVAALGVAFVLRRTMFKGEEAPFLLELPPYRRPIVKTVVRTVMGKGWVFVREAGTIILAISVLLWFLAYFPKDDTLSTEAAQRVEAGEDPAVVADWEASAQLEQSYVGRLGHVIEPIIEPLGYDWKTGVGLIASFAAREVLVSTLGVIHSVGDADEESVSLRERMRADTKADGSPVHTPLTSISLMVFFVLACQCMSTLAVVKRETNSWRWPIFMLVYMTVLAYVASLVVYQGGLALGFGP